ncbi:BRO-N domain-containing protein [Ewingella sp. AOP9-I1-14]
MNAKPAVFSFESNTKIRAITINGSPWFVAIDVCDALGLTNNRDALLKLDDDEKDTVGLTDSQPGMGAQSISIISESGLYTLILRCRDAVRKGTIPYRFRKWVTAEVLPAIHQTGQYSVGKPEMLGDLVGTSTATTMTVRDNRRGKNATASKAAQRIADECVPMIMKAVQNQYHYNNTDVGPAEFMAAIVADNSKTQLGALLRELAENGHNVAGAYRELEIVRHLMVQQHKLMLDIATHAAYIQQATKIR